MKTFFLVLLFCIQTMACDSSLFVEELFIDVDTNVPQDMVLLTGEEGQRALCQQNPEYPRMLHAARKRLKSQTLLLAQLDSKGLVSPAQLKHYQNFFKELGENINSCEKVITQRNNSGFPEFDIRMQYYTKSTGVTRVIVRDEQGVQTDYFTSHIQWLGKLLGHERIDLCQARFYDLEF